MPNSCIGYLSIKCPDNVFEQIKNYVQSENSIFDFNKIIPMPDYEPPQNIRTAQKAP